jgi:hypothetical protein
MMKADNGDDNRGLVFGSGAELEVVFYFLFCVCSTVVCKQADNDNDFDNKS